MFLVVAMPFFFIRNATTARPLKRTIVVNILPSIPKSPPVRNVCEDFAEVRKTDSESPEPLTLIP